MMEMGFVLLFLGIQGIHTWIIYHQVENEREKNVIWWIMSLLLSLVGALAFNAYWWLMLLPFFAIYEYRNQRYRSSSLIYFIVAYSVCIPLLLTRLMILLLHFLPIHPLVDSHRMNWVLWSMVGSTILHVGIIHVMKIDFSVLKRNSAYVKNRIIIPSNLAITIGFPLLFVPFIFEGMTLNSNAIPEYIPYIFVIYAVMFVSLLVFLSVQMNHFLQQELRRTKDEQYEQLNKYTREIEQLYQQIRGFRHDFGNIMSSLGESINREDIEQIRQIYEEILVNANGELNKSNYSFAELSSISNTAVKSMLSTKLMLAEQRGIQVHVEIKTAISSVIIKELDYVRIVSILVDNAIEGAAVSEKQQVEVALIIDNKQLVTLIRNSKDKHTTLTIEKVFEPKFSTKGDGRGAGLHNVKNIVERYDNATLDTCINSNIFTQVLIIRERSCFE